MGKKKEEDYYHNLPRKELQGLCKKYGLSANKTNFDLANLLVSFFKGKDWCKPLLTSTKLQHRDMKLVSSEEISNGHMEVSSPKSCSPELKSEASLNALKDKETMTAFKVDSSGPSNCSKEKEGHDWSQIQPVNQEEISMQMESQSPNKIIDATENLVCTNAANNGTIEGFGRSSPDPGIVDSQPLSTSYFQEISAGLQSNSNCDDKGVNYTRESPKSSIARNSDLNLQNLARIGRDSIMLQMRCRDRNISPGPVSSGLVSSSETPTAVSSGSFQFFVRSEDGINLYVDLNLSPSDWIKSLEKDVCIYQQVHYHKSRVLQKELQGLGDIDKRVNTSSTGSTDPCFHTSEIQKTISSRSINSPINLIAEQHFDVRDYRESITHETFALRSGSASDEISGHLDDSHINSSVSIPDSGLARDFNCSVVSCLRDGQTIPPGLAGYSLKLDSGGAFESGIYKDNCPAKLEVDLKRSAVLNTPSRNGPKCIGSLDCGPIRTGNTYLGKAEVDLIRISDMLSNVSKRSGVLLPAHTLEETIPPDIGSIEKHYRSCHDSSTSGSMGIQLLKDMVGCKEMVIPRPQFDPQTKKVEAVKQQLHQDACSGVGNLVVGDSMSASSEEQGRDISTNEKESSEDLQSHNSLEKTHKRCPSSELEGRQSKKQWNNNEYYNVESTPTSKDLRSMKNLARGSSHGMVVLPRRRSTRLVAK